MMAGDEPGSSTGNLTASNCRYFMPGGQGEATGRLLVFLLAVCGGGGFWSNPEANMPGRPGAACGRAASGSSPVADHLGGAYLDRSSAW